MDCSGGFHSLAGSAAIVELAERYGLTVEAASVHEPPAAGVVRAAVALVALVAEVSGGHAGDEDTKPSGASERFLDTFADRLALGVAAVVAVLDPGCVVLGGEVGQAGGEVLAGRVEERVRRMSPLTTVVRPTGLGGGAVLRGALLTARDAAQDELFAPQER